MVDTAEIKIKAGNGGDGLVSFRREKYNAFAGPWGGDGGRGGDIIIEPNLHANTLQDFRRKSEFFAKAGGPGMKDLKKGADGDDLIIKVPLGTSIYNDENKLIADIIDPDQKIILQKGGRGGAGNWHFKSSTNQTPQQFTYGEKIQLQYLSLELKLIADIGIIGIPSAGKSTLLNSLSRADVKTAAYPFTTLEPNLGVLHVGNFITGLNEDIILADIPGLIEGASDGKGLGFDFLRHIERTNILVHVIDGELLLHNGIEALIESYNTIRTELKNWNEDLIDKREIVVVNKTDLNEVATALPEIKKAFKKLKLDVIGISAYAGINLKELVESLYKVYSEERTKKELAPIDETSPSKFLKFDINNLPNKRIVFKSSTKFIDDPETVE